jgi:hypothetical protein
VGNPLTLHVLQQKVAQIVTRTLKRFGAAF